VSNLRKHGVSFQEATTVFADPLALIVGDQLHPEREIIVGESATGELLVVVFIETRDDQIRIISARRVTSHERRRHEGGEES
jgi:hypothetical protein